MSGEGPFFVPLVALIATPDRYVGVRVDVVGYLDRPLHLYLTRDHAAVEDVSSSIDIIDGSEGGTLTHSTCVSHWVELIGTFYRRSNGLFGIRDAEEVRRLDTYEVCWTEAKSPEP